MINSCAKKQTKRRVTLLLLAATLASCSTKQIKPCETPEVIMIPAEVKTSDEIEPYLHLTLPDYTGTHQGISYAELQYRYAKLQQALYRCNLDKTSIKNIRKEPDQ